MVAIKADRKAKKKGLSHNQHEATIAKHGFKMAQAKACKTIHVVTCIKSIANQVKNRQVEDKKDQSQI